MIDGGFYLFLQRHMVNCRCTEKEIKRKDVSYRPFPQPLAHGGCQVNGPKVAKFLDR